MYFTLEALEARHGDCLILHYGQPEDPRIILIDGGPHRVYANSLRPRLREIQETLAIENALPLTMVMVSHMDEDHIQGILDLLDDLRDAIDSDLPLDFDIQHMWFNTFDDIVGNEQIAAFSGFSQVASVADLEGAVPQLAGVEQHIKAVIASTNQGRRLRDSADLLTVPVNTGFDPIEEGKPPLVRGDAGDRVIDWGDGLLIHVLHPEEERLLEFQKKWDDDLKRARERGDNSIIIASAADRDTSPFNLASIVCLLEFAGKRMLLTGDGREDDILDGLRRANLLDANGRIHVDILKIPHHGSDKNISRHFFQQVTADHYIISGNGRHHNPERSTLIMLAEATRGRDDFTLHLTNHEGQNELAAVLDGFIAGERQLGRVFGVEYRDSEALSLRIDLLDVLDY